MLTHPYLLAAFAYTGETLADPPRRVPRPRRAGRHAPAAARGVRAARRRPAPEADDPRAGRAADEAARRARRATA